MIKNNAMTFHFSVYHGERTSYSTMFMFISNGSQFDIICKMYTAYNHNCNINTSYAGELECNIGRNKPNLNKWH